VGSSRLVWTGGLIETPLGVVSHIHPLFGSCLANQTFVYFFSLLLIFFKGYFCQCGDIDNFLLFKETLTQLIT
jgi:hypothetical protein